MTTADTASVDAMWDLQPVSRGSDCRGRLFLRGKELLRVVYPSAVEEMRTFMRHPEIRALVKDGLLIDGEEIVSHDLPFPLLLRHPLLRDITFPYEWARPMFRDATECMLEVADRAARAGFLFADPHLWNIGFSRGKPVVVDYGAFLPFQNSRTGTSTCFNVAHPCILPLAMRPAELVAQGYGPLVRAFLMKGLPLTDRTIPPLAAKWLLGRSLLRSTIKHLPFALRSRFLKTRGSRINTRDRATAANVYASTSQIRHKLRKLNFGARSSYWRSYHSDEVIRLSPSAENSRPIKKLAVLEQLLEGLSYDSVTDLGCNRGFHSIHFASKGIPVVAIDRDEDCVSDLYEEAKRRRLPINPVVMSIVKLSTLSGLRPQEVWSVGSRMGGELVLALAVVHHLVLGQRCDFFYISELLATYARKYAVVEYIHPDDPTIRSSRRRLPEWYSEGKFLWALSRYFRPIRKLTSYPQSRTLHLLQRR